MKWSSERLGGTFSASLLAKGNTIYAFGDDGKTILFEASDTFKELGRNELTGHVQATPAAAGDYLFIRTEQKLVKVGMNENKKTEWRGPGSSQKAASPKSRFPKHLRPHP